MSEVEMSEEIRVEYVITLIEETKPSLGYKRPSDTEDLRNLERADLKMELYFGLEEVGDNQHDDFQLLLELVNVLDERKLAYDVHGQKLRQIIDLRNKVRHQLEQIDDAWGKMLEAEQKECDMLTAEREHVESQMKSENLLGSKESLHRSATDLSGHKGNKPPPSRVGNYTIMAKRLQTEIKQLEQQVQDMKSRLNIEVENRINLENKVKELRTGLALHKRQDITNPGTPVQ